MSPIDIIYQTSHGYGTHHATSEAKWKLRSYLLTLGSYLSHEEHVEIWHNNITLQHMIDLATLIYLSHGLDFMKEISE